MRSDDGVEDELIEELLERQRGNMLLPRGWEQTLHSFQEQALFGAAARGRYRADLENAFFSPELLSCLTGYFWLSASRSSRQPFNMVILDPFLLDGLHNSTTRARDFWHRQELWRDMKPEKVFLVLNQDMLVLDQSAVWYILEMTVDTEGTSLDIYVPNGASMSRIEMTIQSLLHDISPHFAIPASLEAIRTTSIHFVNLTCEDGSLDISSRSALAALHLLCVKLLACHSGTLHIPTMLNSIRQFYKRDMLNKSPLAPHLPWAGICQPNGTLYGHQLIQDQQEWRMQSPSVSESEESEVINGGLHRDMVAQPEPVHSSDRDRMQEFFLELRRTESAHPQGILEKTVGRSFDDLEEALLLRLPPGQNVPSVIPAQDRDLTLGELVEQFRNAGGGAKNRRQILTGITPNLSGHLHLDWCKEAEIPDCDWFLASTDVDSLSLTAWDPEVCMDINVYPYPDRRRSLNRSNGLTVNLPDGKLIPMHQCPNVCFATIGSNNQFQVNIFFPGRREPSPGPNRRYRNFANEEELTALYDRIFLPTLHHIERQVPRKLHQLYLSVLQSLPSSYLAMEKLCVIGGGRAFLPRKIPREIINLVFPAMRTIVNSNPDLASYRGYFFHIYGINLKQVGFNVHGRAGNNAMQHIFEMYPIVPWWKQNPHDIIADIGLEIHLDPSLLPERLYPYTLLWNQKQMQALVRHSWRLTREDPYCHSADVGGFTAQPRGKLLHGAIKYQVYLKDKVETYVDSERSVGANFTINHALSGAKTFASQWEAFQTVYRIPKCYGVRAEWRLTIWGAMHILRRDPMDLVQNMAQAGAIVSRPFVTQMIPWMGI
ncbi:hypothetical protein RSAG8_07204, partial [Rhizoctonia solani AG-8 WAC10335]